MKNNTPTEQAEMLADSLQWIGRLVREVTEMYVGQEGGMAETAYEAFLLQEQKRMYDELIKIPAAITEVLSEYEAGVKGE